MKRIILTAVCGATAVLTACTAGAPSVETAPFGRLSSGEEVTLYRLRSGNGASMEVIDYGYTEVWELAEYFGVSEECILDAVKIYRNKGLL